MIFSPYTETAGKPSDSLSLSLISQSAESSESSLVRYCCVVCVSVCVGVIAKVDEYLALE